MFCIFFFLNTVNYRTWGEETTVPGSLGATSTAFNPIPPTGTGTPSSPCPAEMDQVYVHMHRMLDGRVGMEIETCLCGHVCVQT